MTRWKAKVERIMHTEGRGAFSALAAMLQAASVLYGGAVKLRGAGYDTGMLQTRRLPCPVISVGNITAGGTGKTPMTLYLARWLKESGRRPVVLSRGYGGGAEKAGAVISDGTHLFFSPETAGDEPFMMAASLKGIPVLVGADRYRSGLRAMAEFDPDVIILDDGFQHRRLNRDIDLVLLDARRPFGNGHMVPRGMLREPVSGIHRADAVVLTRGGGCRTGWSELIGRDSGTPIFRTDHEPYLAGIFTEEAPLRMCATTSEPMAGFEAIESSRVVVFSGIAQNAEFARMMRNRVGQIAATAAFPDHHRYTDAELDHLVRVARAEHADLFVTTEKDYMRIAGRMPRCLPIAVIGVRIRFLQADEAAFLEFIRKRLLTARSDHHHT